MTKIIQITSNDEYIPETINNRRFTVMDKPLQEYYATFMFKQAFKKKFVRIMAQDEGQARDCMFAHFGDKFMTTYNASNWDGQEDEYGLEELCCILVTNHGTEEYPSIEYKLL